jgi:DNA-binding transcriptional LysR family regulator
MNYTLRQLEVFLKISQTLSITKAAEELHLSQPAVSIQLKNLQDQFDIPLTEVVGRKVYLTDFGYEIANAAEKILNEVYAIDYKTQAHKGHLTGRLKISVVSTGKYVMPYFLADFMKKHPGVELIMDVTNKTKVIESLEKNEVDFSLVSILPESLKVESIKLMQNKLFLISNSETKYRSKPYDINIIAKLPMIYREQGSGTRYVMEKFIEEHDLSIKKTMELTSNEAVKQSIIAGLGCSVMPLIGIKNELNNGELQIIPIKGFPIISHWQLIWMKGKNFSPVAEFFLAYLRQEKTNIIKSKFDWFEQY